ncbi:cell division protein SepF [Streptococcus halotolerans]|uniref:cell division protein SepF n=1 Tax=Streptococcus halotolerans TaxID=1814128 RepID=UPI000786E6E4|nr:cell division protein SepF [Streptococcus halotolerans]
MAFFKDTIEKITLYFATDEVSDVEEFEQALPQQEQKRGLSAQTSNVSQERPSQAANQSAASMQGQTQKRGQRQVNSVPSEQAHRDGVAPAQQYRKEQMSNSSQPTIALKYPRKYEDATEIVDLLAGNECVLIDFQYMLEAQARRCLDFVDGASRVLSGNLQKVGSSMYLLTPQFVIVDIEEMTIPNAGQEVNFDYDMKRR